MLVIEAVLSNLGDGTLVEFASVVDAVECAVCIQHHMAAQNVDMPDSKRTSIRIGVNLGDVIIDDDDSQGAEADLCEARDVT